MPSKPTGRTAAGGEKRVEGHGSLRNDLARAMRVSRGAEDAEDRNLCLFNSGLSC